MDVEIVAIDGPSASGKSTVARRVAQALGRVYVDSGSLYRAVTWEALREGTNGQDEKNLAAVAHGLDMAFHIEDGAVRFRVNGRRPGEGLRDQAVNDHVSVVAAVPEVRRLVVGWLRSLTRFGPLVMEGRDIGTVVFPDAAYKFYLDASAEERARRRHAETRDNRPTSVQAVAASLKRRDEIDTTRRTDPLRVAEDARVIDTTGKSIDDVTRLILDRVQG